VKVDTANIPLFGTIVRDTTQSRATDDAAVRAAVDPVYPPVLVHSWQTRAKDGHRARSLLMMLGVEGNRRDGVRVYDGSGVALIVESVGTGGFSGRFLPGGMVDSGKGLFCATRVTR
jgi:hypothetical protein